MQYKFARGEKMSFQKIGNGFSKHVFRSGFLLLGVWLSLPILSSAQEDASIQGTVSDSSGAAIPGVGIQVKNLETGALRNLLTDEAGGFDAASLPVGRYALKAGKSGVRRGEKTGISLGLGQRETVDRVLQCGAGRQ